MKFDDIRLDSYNYTLPTEKIAFTPAQKRGTSKLLVIDKNFKFIDDTFSNISTYINEDQLLVFNNSKVIQARLFFTRETGAKIEIFLLQPYVLKNNISKALQENKSMQWLCYIGNKKKWKESALTQELNIKDTNFEITATIVGQHQDAFIVNFEWKNNAVTFNEILDTIGKIPLPPYILRDVAQEDAERYQTVYAAHNGSVAAPTAGLHFTNEILDEFTKNKIVSTTVSLHVGAGTFKPIKENDVKLHTMHFEQICVSKTTLELLLQNSNKQIVAVGTTSVRTLESLFWIAVKLKNNLILESESIIKLNQWECYDLNSEMSWMEALQTILQYLSNTNSDELIAETQIMIVPGYRARVCKGIITNFHQPCSTLLLLMSALIGENWKLAYNHALAADYRFLSYGDAMLYTW